MPRNVAASPRKRSPWRASSGGLEASALGRHWLLYDLAELGELDEALAPARRARAPCRRPPAALVPALVARVAVRVDGARRPLRSGRAACARLRRPGRAGSSAGGAHALHGPARGAAARAGAPRRVAAPARAPRTRRADGRAMALRPAARLSRRRRPGARARRVRRSARGRGERSTAHHVLAGSLASLAEAAAVLGDAEARRSSPRHSSRTPTVSRSGASRAMRDRCTACWVGRRPLRSSASVRARISRTPSGDTPRSAAARWSPGRGAITASCS